MKTTSANRTFPIAMMFALFFIIAFVTGLQNPMGVIIKSQFQTSHLLSQLGNLANFIAYAFMGIPAGWMLGRIGYKRTSLTAIAVGLLGVVIMWLSGRSGQYGLYLTGAFVSGFSMCMLNTVVNPMLKTLGRDTRQGNQLIQFGGAFNSIGATLAPILVGYLMGSNEALRTIGRANPALYIAMAIFAVTFVVIAFARIPEPHLQPASADRTAPAPVVGDWCAKTDVDQHPEKHPEAARGNFGDAYACRSRKHYYASITFIDEQVGRIVKALKEKGMYDNALICFISDHGDMLGDHHLWRKTYAYEGSSAIPFIVKLPAGMSGNLQPGEEIEAPVELRDLLPTFLDVNGSPVPEDMDGLSLLPLLQGKKHTPWRKYIDMEHATSYWEDNYWCALTDGKVKYIWFFHSGQEQLFDLTEDPNELHDLADDPSHRSLLEEMRQAMVNHLQERGEEWVKDGKLVQRKQNQLYSPNYPTSKNNRR